MDFDKIYTVKKEHSKEQFIRAVMIELASNIDTPVDVARANFGEVKESIKEVIVCSAHVESDYSASIGYDRQEQYQTTESRRVNEGDWYTCNGVQKRATYSGSYSVDVIKTRTVTDWKPHIGHIGGDATCVAMNSDEDYSESRLINVIKSTKDESVIEKGDATVSFAGLEVAKNNCRYTVESRISFPGDRHKDVRSNASVDVQSTECWKLPFYEVEFIYQGQKFIASDFACGDFDVNTEYPSNEVDFVAVATKETKPFRVGMIAGWSLFGGLFVLSCILMAVNFYWMWVPTTVVLGVAIALHIISDKKYYNRVKDLSGNSVVLKQKELEDVLVQKGYDRLTSAEIGLFNAESKSTSYAQMNKRKGVVLPAVLCSIATVILIIVSLVLGSIASSKALHSPDQFQVAVTSKTQEYKSNVSPYINGCYYIYLTYDVTSKEIGAEYLQLKTTVMDKSGKEIGTINTSLSDMNLDSNSKKQYSTYLQDNQPEQNRNTFFITLYNAKYADLSFKVEITSIQFSDGEYWSA